MPNTTNYSWATPADTDLVKDGAAAIRTLGNSVDTTTKNLNPQTTTGALAYRSATANVNTALAIGTAGQVLTVNSGATAPEWATATGGGMTLLSTTTLSGTSTSISVTPTGYNELNIQVSGVTAASGFHLIMGVNSDGTASNYRNAGFANVGYGTTVDALWKDTSLAGHCIYLIPGTNAAQASDTNNAAMITIGDPNSVLSKNIFTTSAFLNDSAHRTPEISFTNYVTTSAISTLQFKSNSSLTAGTVKIYGVK
jgi:hypothetical protein